MFCLHNLKVFTLRILKYSVGKSAKNEKWSIMGVFLSEYARSRHYGVFYVQNLKVFAFRILKNYVGKSAYYVFFSFCPLG